jgi:hypothetical protein
MTAPASLLPGRIAECRAAMERLRLELEFTRIQIERRRESPGTRPRLVCALLGMALGVVAAISVPYPWRVHGQEITRVRSPAGNVDALAVYAGGSTSTSSEAVWLEPRGERASDAIWVGSLSLPPTACAPGVRVSWASSDALVVEYPMDRSFHVRQDEPTVGGRVIKVVLRDGAGDVVCARP